MQHERKNTSVEIKKKREQVSAWERINWRRTDDDEEEETWNTYRDTPSLHTWRKNRGKINTGCRRRNLAVACDRLPPSLITVELSMVFRGQPEILFCLPYILSYKFNIRDCPLQNILWLCVVNKRLRCDELDSCSCLFPTMPRSTHWRRALNDMVLHMFIISFIFPTHPASLRFPFPPAKS